jgi:hypothetical protein
LPVEDAPDRGAWIHGFLLGARRETRQSVQVGGDAGQLPTHTGPSNETNSVWGSASGRKFITTVSPRPSRTSQSRQRQRRPAPDHTPARPPRQHLAGDGRREGRSGAGRGHSKHVRTAAGAVHRAGDYRVGTAQGRGIAAARPPGRERRLGRVSGLGDASADLGQGFSWSSSAKFPGSTGRGRGRSGRGCDRSR